jgi:hypothetical protein
MTGLVKKFNNTFMTGDNFLSKSWRRFGDPLMAKALGKTETPTLESPTVMPTSDDEAVKAARRRQIAEVQARSGRASTILSQTDQLGG